jgi:hypothetical protein
MIVRPFIPAFIRLMKVSSVTASNAEAGSSRRRTAPVLNKALAIATL